MIVFLGLVLMSVLLFADTKEDLSEQKTAITAKISVLETKEGMAAFVAEKIAAIDAVRAKLKPKPVAKNQVSMLDFLGLIKTGIVKDPNSFVAREVKRLTAESASLAVVLTEPNAIEKPIEVKPK